MSRDLAYLLDILDAARLVQQFAQGVSRSDLARDMTIEPWVSSDKETDT
ncbi:MAG: hypothetical protein ACUVSU_09425 [Aggregatilineaceae bacterium]